MNKKDAIETLKNGMLHCVFLTRNANSIEGIIDRTINDPNVVWFSVRPTSVKIDTLDDLHDKLSLLYDDDKDNVEVNVTWEISDNGKHYRVAEIE